MPRHPTSHQPLLSFEQHAERWLRRCAVTASRRLWDILRHDEALEQVSIVSLRELKHPKFIVELNGQRRFEVLSEAE